MSIGFPIAVGPYSPDEDKLALGRWVNQRYRNGFQIQQDDGSLRVITNFEMSCSSEASRVAACEKRDRDGCCGQHGIQGRCYGCGGWCPRVEEIDTAISFCNAFLEWIAEITLTKESSCPVQVSQRQLPFKS